MDFGTLFAGVVFGAFGVAAWRWGKAQGKARPMLLGVALVGFPYFAPDGWAVWAIGTVLTLFVFWP